MAEGKNREDLKRVYLEEWLHNKIRDEALTDPDFRGFPGGGIPERPTRADVDNYHLFRLRKLLSYASENSSFYRDLFDKNHIRPSDIVSLADLAKIPFTDQADLARNPNRFLCVSHGDIARVTTFTTSGTTGPEKRIYCTDGDIGRIVEFMGAGMRTVTEKEDVVQIMLPSGSTSNQADLLEQGVLKIGAKAIKAGLNLSSEEQLDLIKKHGATVIFGVASPVYRMTQELKGLHALDGLGVKTIFLTSFLADTQREYLRRVWNCDVHSHYGLTEMGLAVAVECHAHDGYHFNEADLLLEIIDPETGRVLGEGEGELVFTTLTRQGTPLIRYRTNDIARLIPEPCPCGAATLRRFGPVKRRLELIVRLSNGRLVYPSLFDEVLYTLTELVDYDLRVTGTGGRERLHFTVETTGQDPDIRDRVRQLLFHEPALRPLFAENTMDEPEITVVPPGGILQMGRAKKKIIDERVM
ncbi:MAG: Phenylacetate-coenzyme A ligase [Syntrophorhabdus sp. PtaU1.Bin058]|nr:MAG: Phenylacetate-coenzyme A ligase [Syntrophorhabdus sp. PtaU1.Bin058]